MTTIISKICTKCKMKKPLEKFGWCGGSHNRLAHCRDCMNYLVRLRNTPQKMKAKRLKFSTNNPLYIRWEHMKRRCLESSHPDYIRYGARGIKICERWLTYKNFENDMLQSYREGLTLDRTNNDGDYCPENCKWATRLEQSNNTRKTKKITYRGRTLSVSRWAAYLGVKRSLLQNRLFSLGWPIEKALTLNIPIYWPFAKTPDFNVPITSNSPLS